MLFELMGTPSTTYSGVTLEVMDASPRMLITGAEPTCDPDVDTITPAACPSRILSILFPVTPFNDSLFIDVIEAVRSRSFAVP